MASDYVGSPSSSLNCLHRHNYISMNWLLFVRIRARALHIVCSCVTVVLGFAAHSIISGTDSDAGDCSEDDRYNSLGYGSDFEEFLAEYSD